MNITNAARKEKERKKEAIFMIVTAHSKNLNSECASLDPTDKRMDLFHYVLSKCIEC